MIKKICFSLWGKDPKYTVGAVRNAELAHSVYPGWKTFFYIGNDVDDNTLKQIEDAEGELIFMNDSGWNGMFWRFFGADSEDIFISRDVDSRLNNREKIAVEEWLESDKDFHIMRDHPFHKTEILGGMWGCRNGILKGLKDLIKEYDAGDQDNKYQADQTFLRNVVYQKIKHYAIVHDEFFERKPFPIIRKNRFDFVGQVYDEKENPQFIM